jgi:hypothetical protein
MATRTNRNLGSANQSARPATAQLDKFPPPAQWTVFPERLNVTFSLIRSVW